MNANLHRTRDLLLPRLLSKQVEIEPEDSAEQTGASRWKPTKRT